MAKIPCVYILANYKYGTLYVGVTSNPVKRIWEHKNKVIDGFSQRYSLDKLVYYELHEVMESAIYREKQLKNWQRKWKLQLVNKTNPNWCDLSEELIL